MNYKEFITDKLIKVEGNLWVYCNTDKQKQSDYYQLLGERTAYLELLAKIKKDEEDMKNAIPVFDIRELWRDMLNEYELKVEVIKND